MISRSASVYVLRFGVHFAALAALALLTNLLWIGRAEASPCNGAMVNPITDVSWACVFPIQVGGIPIGPLGGSDQPNLDRDNPDGPLCVCPSPTIGIPTPGIRVNFWRPERMIDTTENPGCLSALGVDVMREQGRGHGTRHQDEVSREVFAQSHYYKYPAWAVLDLFTDIPCLGESGFDIAYMSEIDPTYQNAVLGMLVFPETVLFANPAAILSCIADAGVASIQKSTIDALFWCVGSWGTTYPMGGYSQQDSYVVAQAHIASKQLFKMGRLGLLRVSDRSGCFDRPSLIWEKDKFKMHLMKPTRQRSCVNLGQAGLLWAGGKGRPHNTNYTWQVFEKVYCCVNP